MIEKRNVVEGDSVQSDKMAQVIDAGVDQFMKKATEKPKESTDEGVKQKAEAGRVP
jgi:hypothetical protein